MMRHLAVLMVGAAVLFAPALAHSQAAGPPNALQGFSKNRDLPVKIDAGSLEVRDKNKIATFSGNVQVVQGDTTLRCNTLQVFYDQQDSAGNSMTAAKPGPGGQGKIRRLEARGNVVVTSKDQTATGDTGIFDMAQNTVTLNGNVIVSQGPSGMLRGEKLTVNLTTGISHVESGKGSGGRVQGLFLPSSIQEQKNQQQNGKNTSASAKDNAKESAAQTETAPAPARRPAHPSGLY
jgi:lipopolysaccharide export system protein LptA